MKKFLILLLFVCIASVTASAKWYSVIMYKHDGTELEGLINDFKPTSKTLSFKVTKDAKAEKIQSSDIKLLKLFDGDNVAEMEYLPNIPYYKAMRDNPTPSKPVWMSIAERGPVNLYIAVKTSRSVGTWLSYSDYFYYCKRSEEQTALHIAISYGETTIKIGDPFHKIASKYFSDVPELAEKIKNKEKGYKSDDIVAIVREYNAAKLIQE